MAPEFSNPAFKIVVLGCRGGPIENDLSGYLVAPFNSNNFLALDAGSLLEGIYLAHQQKSFQEIEIDSNDDHHFEVQILKNYVRAYLISHAHLDHVRALVTNSPLDSTKKIYGIDTTINNIRDHLFNNKIWPNFGSEGEKPIHKYLYHRLKFGQKSFVENTEMSVEPFLLNHPNGYQSTAFLVEHADNFLLYFGDTAPDELEPQKNIESIWNKVAPLIQQKKLKAIFLECSYDDSISLKDLYGHLTPNFMIRELKQLAALVDSEHPETALRGLIVIVTHIKDFLINSRDLKESIRQELENTNNLGIKFIFPTQGQKIVF